MAPPQDGHPVELESDVPEAIDTEPTVPAEAAATAETAPEAQHAQDGAVVTPEVTAEVVSEAPVEVAVAVEPAPRGRRRRGRVVAPAGRRAATTADGEA